jgi:hypothetical protein
VCEKRGKKRYVFATVGSLSARKFLINWCARRDSIYANSGTSHLVSQFTTLVPWRVPVCATSLAPVCPLGTR